MCVFILILCDLECYPTLSACMCVRISALQEFTFHVTSLLEYWETADSLEDQIYRALPFLTSQNFNFISQILRNPIGLPVDK